MGTGVDMTVMMECMNIIKKAIYKIMGMEYVSR